MQGKIKILLLVGAALLVSCVSPTVPLTDAQQVLQQQLNAEGPQCAEYRQDYVRSFGAHVAAMSAQNEQGQDAARLELQRLAEEHTSNAHCTRPLCIIEPQQNGLLTSWCGYRYADSTEDEVHQWVQWQLVEPVF